jgi:hypothetical protein
MIDFIERKVPRSLLRGESIVPPCNQSEPILQPIEVNRLEPGDYVVSVQSERNKVHLSKEMVIQ